MNMWVTIAISALSDFVITAGTAYMAVSNGTYLPSTSAIVLCVIGGLVQAARGVQKAFAPPPT